LTSYGFRLQKVAETRGKLHASGPNSTRSSTHLLQWLRWAPRCRGFRLRPRWLGTISTVTNSGEKSKNHLYRNKQNGTFEEVAVKDGRADLNSNDGVSMGAVWGDYDNDRL
jgi:hypothetical protein